MKKRILIGTIVLSNLLFGESFIDLKNPDIDAFQKKSFPIAYKFKIKVKENEKETFSKGYIKISISKKRDYIMNSLNKVDYEFFSSYFLSTMDSANSSILVYYSWTDNKDKKHSKVCFKKKVKINKNELKKKSSCAIMEELGTVDVDNFIEQNKFQIFCQDVIE